MKNWNRLMKETSTRTDKPIKPQVIAVAVSDELEENAIISVDWHKHNMGCSLHLFEKGYEIFTLGYAGNNGMWFAVQ